MNSYDVLSMFTHTPTHGRSHVVQSILGNYSAWWADAGQTPQERNLFPLPVLFVSRFARTPSFPLANSTVDIAPPVLKKSFTRETNIDDKD